MAVDTPARIAVLGAGPIGLETALYARYLGYDVDVYEQGRVAEHVLRWGHVRMFSPFGMNRSPLGLAALKAQDEAYRPPADDALLTGAEWAERYLLPLSVSDLLADHLRTGVRVVGVSRRDLLKQELPGSVDRDESPFVLLLSDMQRGREFYESADVVIDTTGVLSCPSRFGPGGLPAIGETSMFDEALPKGEKRPPAIDRVCPDVLGGDRERFAGRHSLVVGSGYSAATTVVALAQLAEDVPGTRVTWITRRRAEAGSGPLRRIPGDRLAERERLACDANRLALEPASPVDWWHETHIEAVSRDEDGRLAVQCTGRHAGAHAFDRIVSLCGYRPDRRIYRELQVHECYASEGPMKLAAALLGSASGDCLDQSSHGAAALLNPEPDFYILGAKSYGRNSSFLFSLGLEQIRELFTVIGDRESLNLYESVRRLA